MKGLLRVCIVTMVLTMLLLTGCSDDKKSSSSTGPELDPSGYHYYFAIGSTGDEGRDSEYMLMVTSYDGSEVNSVEAIVDGESVTMEGYAGNFYGYIDLPVLTAINVILTINGSNYNLVMDVAPEADINWPDNLDMEGDNEITWTLTPDENPDVQEIAAWTSDYEENEEDYFESLSSSDRSWNIPENWLNEDITTIEIDYFDMNYVEDGELLALSIEGDGMIYSVYGREAADKEEFFKKTAAKVAESFK